MKITEIIKVNFLHTSGILQASIFSFFRRLYETCVGGSYYSVKKALQPKKHMEALPRSREEPQQYSLDRRLCLAKWTTLRAPSFLASKFFGKADTHSWRGLQLLIRSIRIIHRRQSNKYWSTQHCRVSSEVQVSPPETVSAITLPSTPSPLVDMTSSWPEEATRLPGGCSC